VQQQIDQLRNEVQSTAAQLTKLRTQAAKRLSPQIKAQLAELGMEKCDFSIALTALDEPTPSGFDAIEFMVQTNPGLPMQPLRKIASGGEVGRLMLAVKSVLAGGDRVDSSPSSRRIARSPDAAGLPGASVLVFDEVDANIGGRLGSIIGAKLRQLAAHHQVLCITHLPQIAAHADRHLTVSKNQLGRQTTTTVRAIEGDARIEELAEMIGGKHITPTTRAQARELLDQSSPKPASRRKKSA
jgi:DNA repair protein RecN (Recombination protein N)